MINRYKNSCASSVREIQISLRCLFQSVPWPSSSEPHDAGAQAAERFSACTYDLHQRESDFFGKSCPHQREAYTSNKWLRCPCR